MTAAPSPGTTVPTVPTVRIRAHRGWRAPDLKELWRYRELIWTFSRRELTVRYRQTIVGVTWILVGPLLSAGIFTFVFGRVAGLPSDGIPYFAFSYGGLLLWNAFSTTLNKTTGVILMNSGMISKVYVPKLILPFAGLAGMVVNLIVGSVVLGGLMIGYGIAPTPRLLLVPVWLIMALCIALGVGLVFAAFVVYFRDINYIAPILMSLLLYLSPVAYAASAVPKQFATLYRLNPMTSLLEGFRWSVFGTGHIVPWATVYAGVLAISIFVAGVMIFTRMERSFPDVI